MRRRELLALLGSALTVRGRAQEATFSTGVKVVNVLATVRDQRGRHIQDLTQADFELREDGRPQEIRYFSRQTDVALTLGVLVDTSMSQASVLDQERNAAREFFWQVLRPDRDAAFVIRFDVEAELSQDQTNSLTKLARALEGLDLPAAPGRRGRGGRGGKAPVWGGIGTLLYDAVFLAADEVLRPLDGRKALILLSDGVDYGSRTTLDRAVRTAQEADAGIYSIRMAEPARRGLLGIGQTQRRNGDRALRRLAEETGGKYYEVTGKQPLEVVFGDIEADLRNQYNLGYVSDRPAASGEFRKIAVAVKRKGMTVQARSGYYAR
jgi:VWFA-related protein